MASARFADEKLDGATMLVAVAGELDMTTTGELRRHVHAALSDGCVRVVVDLSDVTHIDSSGLAELLAGYRHASELHGGLALVVTSRAIRRTLEIRGVDGLLTVAPTRELARVALA